MDHFKCERTINYLIREICKQYRSKESKANWHLVQKKKFYNLSGLRKLRKKNPLRDSKLSCFKVEPLNREDRVYIHMTYINLQIYRVA